MSPLLGLDSSTSVEAVQREASVTIITEEDKIEPVAITGLSFKFPQGATSREAFWDILLEGKSAMMEVSKGPLQLGCLRSSKLRETWHYKD